MIDRKELRKAEDYTMQNKTQTRKVNDLKTIEILLHLDENTNAMTAYANICLEAGWTIVAVDSRHGTCWYDRKTIGIPVWCILEDTEKNNGILHYYLAHELAHVIAGFKNGHNQIFMEAFKSLCIKEYWHHEFDYITSQALKAGILPEDF